MASCVSTITLTALLTGLFALVPDEARACSDICGGLAYFDDVQPVNAAAIPIDGVLVLRATGRDLEDADLIASLELTVTRDGQPIAGAVEATAGVGVLVWRPSLPFEPGAHAVHTSFANPDNDDPYAAGCGPEDGESDFEFLVEDAPAQPLVPPVVTHEQSVSLQGSLDLKDLVCCDGAFPEENGGGSCGSEQSYWFEGQCASLLATGLLQIELTAQPQQDLATSGLLLRSFLVDGVPEVIGVADQASSRFDHLFCTQVELLNLATGETSISEQVCHGQELAAQLGPQVVDPTIELAGKCEGPLYTCAIIGEFPARWDPETCTPLEAEETTNGPTSSDSQSATDSADVESDSDPTTAGPGSDTTPTSDSETDGASGGQDGLIDHGCACDSGPGDPAALLGLLGLGLLARRRRR